MRRVWSGIRLILDGGDAIAAVVSFVVLVVLLVTGHLPHSVELWLSALAGAALVAGVGFAVFAWVRRRG